MLGQVHQFVRRRFRRSIEFRQMRVWNDEQMTTDVRVNVENDEIVRGAMKDELALVVNCVLLKLAEDAG